jgi:hypothetical protein
MAIRMLDTEHLTAVAFGAGDALVTGKVTGSGPGGIPWPVLYEGAGVVAGFFGEKVGIPAQVRDSVLISSLALAGARLTRAALAGKLMSGPKAWGGDHAYGGDYSSLSDGSGGGGQAVLPGPARLRVMNQARGGGFSLTGSAVPFLEPAGVAG